MSYLANQLKHRISIFQAIDTPNNKGGLTRTYKTLITLWSRKRNISFPMQIRHVNTEKSNRNAPIDTDEFAVRYDSVVSNFNRTFNKGFADSFDSKVNKGMGRSFDGGFDNGFDSLIDPYPIKTNFFVFLKQGNDDAFRGRLFKINRISIDDENKELVLLRCAEVQEMGTGATYHD